MSPSSAAVFDKAEVRDTATSNKYLEAGRRAEQAGDRMEAIKHYEAAFTADPDSADVCFRLAYNLDLVGEEEEAIHLYEQCVQRPQAPLHALINLSVLYEDRGQYAAAERCIRQVLTTEPNHNRARLYIKDILASREMQIDDDSDKQRAKYAAALETPVTDFDLSVRTRNALRKMNIRTLADLLRITEAELRSFKNFGESSIEEIKTMLAQRGLKLGQAIEQQNQVAKQAVYDQLKTETGQDEETFRRSVNDLSLSVRARKALALLNVQTLGDLCLKTEAELMGVKNFGVTSLTEIREKLEEMGLGLRKLEE
jgi:DNA-directed RNA polymerase subunit alpha